MGGMVGKKSHLPSHRASSVSITHGGKGAGITVKDTDWTITHFFDSQNFCSYLFFSYFFFLLFVGLNGDS